MSIVSTEWSSNTGTLINYADILIWKVAADGGL